jgi:hypothetical protein
VHPNNAREEFLQLDVMKWNFIYYSSNVVEMSVVVRTVRETLRGSGNFLVAGKLVLSAGIWVVILNERNENGQEIL